MSVVRTPGPWHGKRADGKYDLRKYKWEVHHETAALSEAAPICDANNNVLAIVVNASKDYYSGTDATLNANAAFIVEACNNYERVCAERNELVTVLNAIRIQAVDAQLRATYQRTALEQISAKARAVLEKVTPA